MASLTAHIILDANIALHFKRIDQIDWLALSGATEAILIIPPIFLRELEHQKVHNPSRKLRDRATATIKWLSGFLETENRTIRKGVTLEFVTHEPQLDFSAHRLSLTLNDDQLIASALDIKEGGGKNLLIATDDIGLKAKLRAHGLTPLSLTDELRLPNEPDPLEQEIQELRAAKSRLEARIPKLKLEFIHESETIRLTVKASSECSVATVEEIREEYPQKPIPPPPPSSQTRTSSPRVLGRLEFLNLLSKDIPDTPETVRAHNQELQNFYSEWAEYREKFMEWKEFTEFGFGIDLVLDSYGSAPASDIDISISFPEGIVIYTKKMLPERPEAPKPPSQTYNQGMALAHLVSPVMSLPTIDYNFDGSPSVEIEERLVTFHIRKLKHNHSFSLDPFYIRFEDRTRAKNFHAEYSITLAEAPQPIEGRLNFIVENVPSGQTSPN